MRFNKKTRYNRTFLSILVYLSLRTADELFVMRDSVKHIAQLTRQFKRKLNKQLPFLELEVNSLIARKCTEEQEIEANLDILLSLHNFNICTPIFIRLLEYYKTINPESAANYWHYFDERCDKIF